MKKMKITGVITFFLLQLCYTKNDFAAITFTVPHPTAKPVVTVPGSLDDTNIKYFGRWDFSNAAQYVSYWGGSYIRVNFTGTTVQFKTGNTTNYYVRIDNGPWTSYMNVSGTVNLTPAPLSKGVHTLSIAQGKDYNYVFNFQGLILDPGATTSAPPVSSMLIEYIGDSITSGYTDTQANVSDYAWVCSESLNSDHTQIAYPGINLVSGYSRTGMDSQYFKQQSLAYPSSPIWDFSGYTPGIVVINLGQNDDHNKVPDSLFQQVYTMLLTVIRMKFPNAEIFALRTFRGVKAVPTLAAVNARKMGGDSKVHYVDTDGWLTTGTSDYNDNVHPSVSGHIKAAGFLKPILAPYINNKSAVTSDIYLNSEFTITNH